jgi:hypothetical protein
MDQGTFENKFQTGYGIELDWRIVSQSIANNTSTIEAKLFWCSYGSSYFVDSSVKKPGNITINGSVGGFTEPNAGLNGNQRKLLHTFTRVVTHNTDGTKSITISGRFDCQVTLSGNYKESVSVSGTAVLDKINRGRMNVKVGTVWKNGQVWVNVNGTWKKAIGVFVNSGGTWKRSI